MVPPPASTITAPSPFCSKFECSFYVHLKPKELTRNARVSTPLLTAKWRLASPSVTKETREWPPGVSGIRPAFTIARRIWLCSGPSQPLGWERTNWTFFSTESHKSGPFAWTSWIYALAHWNKYRRKSENTSTTVLFKGRGGIFSVMSSPNLERRWNLNLELCLMPFGRTEGLSTDHSALTQCPSSASSYTPSRVASAPTARTLPVGS